MLTSNIIRFLIGSVVLALVSTSCSSEIGDNDEGVKRYRTVIVRRPQIIEDQTNENMRSVVQTYPEFKFVWTGNETIGIYPEGSTPIPFTLTGNKSPSEATFSYKDEVLVPGKKYYSFCPYTDLLSESTPQNIEISYEGQTMDKFLDTDDNITHIGNYDFLYASTVIPTDTATIPEFGFKRIGALIRLKIDLPELNAIYKKMTFTALEEPQTINQFVVGGRLDMDSGRLYDVKKSPEMTLYLDNIVATEEIGTQVYTAIMIYPGDKRYGFKLSLEYESNGELKNKLYYVNGYIYKPNYYYKQVAMEY